MPCLLQYLVFKLLPRGYREAAANWVLDRRCGPKGCGSSGTLCVGLASPRETQHTAAPAAELLWAAKPNAGVRNKPPSAANSPLGLGKEPCRGSPVSAARLAGTRQAPLACELGLTMPQARGHLPFKPGPSLPPRLPGAAGRSCALVPGRRGAKGGRPPRHCLCCVYQSLSNPAEESGTGSAFMAWPAAEPPGQQGRGEGGRPASRQYQAFPHQQTGTGTGQHLNGVQAAPPGLPEDGDTPESSRKEEQAAACTILALRPGLC